MVTKLFVSSLLNWEEELAVVVLPEVVELLEAEVD